MAMTEQQEKASEEKAAGNAAFKVNSWTPPLIALFRVV